MFLVAHDLLRQYVYLEASGFGTPVAHSREHVGSRELLRKIGLLVQSYLMDILVTSDNKRWIIYGCIKHYHSHGHNYNHKYFCSLERALNGEAYQRTLGRFPARLP